MLEIVKMVLALANSGLTAYNLHKSQKYIDAINEIMKDLQEEMARGQDADDAKIVFLQDRLKIEVQSAQMDIFSSPPAK